jgi:hypothetical protein
MTDSTKPPGSPTFEDATALEKGPSAEALAKDAAAETRSRFAPKTPEEADELIRDARRWRAFLNMAHVPPGFLSKEQAIEQIDRLIEKTDDSAAAE